MSSVSDDQRTLLLVAMFLLLALLISVVAVIACIKPTALTLATHPDDSWESNRLSIPDSHETSDIVSPSGYSCAFWDVLAHETVIVFGVEFQDRSREHVHPRVSPRDLRAAHRISLFLSGCYAEKGMTLIDSGSKRWQLLLHDDTSLILIGGFVTNSEYAIQAPRFARYWRLKMGRICETTERRCYHVDFGSLPSSLKEIPRETPHAIDKLSSEYVSKDYALITTTTATLYGALRHVLAVAGIKGHGTVGGAMHITTPRMLEDLNYQLRETSNQDMVELLVRVDVASDIVDTTKLIGIAVNGNCLLRPAEDEWEPCELPYSCKECTFGEDASRLTNTLIEQRFPFRTMIFDLDDTLVDTYGTIITTLTVDAASRILSERSLELSVGEVSIFLLELRRRCPNLMADELRGRYPAIAKDLENAQVNLLRDVSVEALRLRSEVTILLEELTNICDLYLITEGSKDFQKRKIDHLKIAKYFKDTIVLPSGEGTTKHKAISDIIASNRYLPSQVAVVGNRLDNEIRIGNRLGVTTVWVKSGEGSEMRPTCKDERPNYTINDIVEIRDLFLEPFTFTTDSGAE